MNIIEEIILCIIIAVMLLAVMFVVIVINHERNENKWKKINETKNILNDGRK